MEPRLPKKNGKLGFLTEVESRDVVMMICNNFALHDR